MNYRHIYHAGNFADVFKHVIMLLGLGYLQQKDKGLLLLDAFAGIGLYDMASYEAKRTKEFEDGIDRFMASDIRNPDLQHYRTIIDPFYTVKTYPGSPMLLAGQMRPQDRVVANELHPADNQTLQQSMKKIDRVRITERDAYECLRTELPPSERRGLILIDPPFERTDEFEMLGRQMFQWEKRFPTGCYMIWYPIKKSLPVADYYTALDQSGFKGITVFELHLKNPANPDGLVGCGMALLNTPYGLEDRFNALAPELGELLHARTRTQTIKPA